MPYNIKLHSLHRTRSNLVAALIAIATILGATACSESPTVIPDPTPKSALTITGPTGTVYETDSVAITAVVRDANGVVAPSAPVTWSVSDTTLAVFAENGKLVARKNGVVTVTAQSGTLSATHQVTITRPAVLKVEVSTSMSVIVRGDVISVNVRMRGPNDRYIVGRVVTGVSDNPAVASLDNAGRLTGRSAGVANITVTCEGVSATIAIRVQEPVHDLTMRTFNGARLPTLLTGDTLVINGVKEYHELWVESGYLRLTNDPNQYRVRLNFFQYRVDMVNGQRTLVPIGAMGEGDRGLYTTDASGALQLTSRDISPLTHSAVWSGNDLRLHYNIAGTSENYQLTFRNVPE
jgi:hypothetical protein